jgi:LysM repeat protein
MDPTVVKELMRETRRLQRRLWLERSLFILLLVPMSTLWLYPRFADGPTAIQVDGRTVAVVASREAAERTLTVVKEARAGKDAASATFARPVVLRRAGRAAGGPVSEEAAAARVGEVVSVTAPRAVILVDGRPVVALPSEREAGAALALVKAHYSEQADRLVEEPSFKEQVTIRRQLAPGELWKASAEEAATFLREGPVTEGARHTIAPGDTPSGIATQYHLTVDALTRLNPGLNPGALRLGDTLNVNASAQPPLTVVVRARVRRLPKSLRTAELRHGPAEVTYENGTPVAATAVTKTPTLEKPKGGVVRF